jgi:hypothetical protein
MMSIYGQCNLQMLKLAPLATPWRLTNVTCPGKWDEEYHPMFSGLAQENGFGSA